MDAQSHIESATRHAAAGKAAAVDLAVPERDDMDELLATIEAELVLQEQSLHHDRELVSQELTSEEFEESIRSALEGLNAAVEDVPLAMQSTATVESQAAIEIDVGESLEAVELELALQNQNLISLGFEDSIRTALAGIGGEMLFQMRIEREDCQRIAAVRIGQGEEQQFALVIMPPGGGLMRVEPLEQSNNPLAMITESYAGLVDSFRAAA